MHASSLSLTLLVGSALAGPLLAQHVVYEDLPSSGPQSPLGIDDVEITPDGRYAVARDNTINSSTRIYDLLNPGTPVVLTTSSGFTSGACQDGVAVTNERAIIIGSRVLIVDLTQPGFPILLDAPIGIDPRDVVITPDGTKAVVRGGDGLTGGTYVFDLASATQLAHQPGDIGLYGGVYDYSLDTVVADNFHAVSLSYVGPPNAPTTRVTIWSLQPPAGGPPVVVFETVPGTDLDGAPHDLALAPDCLHAAVRSVHEVARLDLALGAEGIQWSKRLWQDPGPFGGSALDSIDMTDSVVISISRVNSAAAGMQVDLFDAAGNQSYSLQNGDPHDLAITPDGTRAVVRTNQNIQLWSLAGLPTTDGTFLVPADFKVFGGPFTGLGGGFDSIELTDERCLAMSTQSVNETKVRVFDITNGFDRLLGFTINSAALDLAITPDETRAVVVGTEDLAVIDMVGNTPTLAHLIPISSGGYSWCDGVALNNTTAVAFGTLPGSAVVFGGWLTQVDLFTAAERYCDASVNSTGQAAVISVSGSSDEINNDLRVVAGNLPTGQFGFFFYGDQSQNVPMGNGNNCVGGQLARFAVQTSNDDRFVELDVDNQALPIGGGALMAGSTWNFQYIYRDPGQMAGHNLTDALRITFE
ncbi:MAG: hypothetical protein ACI8QC_002072 [Planctomycetota bacterium]|jgi:hypothetical protein